MQDCIEIKLESMRDTAEFIERTPLPDEYHGWRLDEVRSKSLHPSVGDLPFVVVSVNYGPFESKLGIVLCAFLMLGFVS